MGLGAILLGVGAILSGGAAIAGLIGRGRAADKQKSLAKKTARYRYGTDLQRIALNEERGREFISGQQVGAAMTGATGGSVTGALAESERQLGRDLSLARTDASKRLAFGLEGADVEYQANKSSFWDYAGVAGSFAADVAGSGLISGNPQQSRRNRRVARQYDRQGYDYGEF